MNLDADGVTCRVPTLVQLCQRVCASSIDSISGLGDELRYRLVRPILERCNAEQLLRLEENSPHLENDTQDIWKRLCHEDFSLAIERYSMGSEDNPRSWKDHYFFLREAEARRLEEASAKLRNQRLVAEERKKEREVKITDRLPPPKRQRTGGWGSSPAPKSLFQKTRSDASKLQKNLFNRIVPPMPPNGKKIAVLPNHPTTNMEILPPISGTSTSRVTVNNVIRRLPGSSINSSASIKSSSSSSSAAIALSSQAEKPLAAASHPAPSTVGKSPAKSPAKPPLRADSSIPVEIRPLKPPGNMKKDPMASLFVPKHRAHSQLP
ncbi:Elongin-A [Termitomyces sp. J132]|nr:Elongin-A [Termitomyces sp. J132]